jgi:hypothetical protein
MSTTISLTGSPSVTVEYREVWTDQVDDFGAACPVCSTIGNVVEATIYVPTRDGRQINESCLCCVVAAVLDTPGYDPTRDVLVEYSKGMSRK